MSDSTVTRTQADRADQTRARILTASIIEFSQNGLAGARTEQIAEAAGVNKALLYYYFRSKDDLYKSALETVADDVRVSSLAVLEAEGSTGERFLRVVLNHFDRIHSNQAFQSLMQHEMIRFRQGESNSMETLAEKLMRPLWARMRVLIEEGIACGELIPADWTQMMYAALGANVFYFLSSPVTILAEGFNPLEPRALEFRRKVAIEYLGQTLFVDRQHGARIAAKVIASTPFPERVELAARKLDPSDMKKPMEDLPNPRQMK